jgi:ABC-type nitrate/sulfonate/bicarbonate transport system permease component
MNPILAFTFQTQTNPTNPTLPFMWVLIVIGIVISKQRLQTFLKTLCAFAIGIAAGIGIGFLTGASAGAKGQLSGTLAMIAAAVISIGHGIRSKETPQSKLAG